MSELNYLIYVSSGFESINYQLPFLISHFENSNKVYGITELLLFDDNDIMQYLEGPKLVLINYTNALSTIRATEI